MEKYRNLVDIDYENYIKYLEDITPDYDDTDIPYFGYEPTKVQDVEDILLDSNLQNMSKKERYIYDLWEPPDLSDIKSFMRRPKSRIFGVDKKNKYVLDKDYIENFVNNADSQLEFDKTNNKNILRILTQNMHFRPHSTILNRKNIVSSCDPDSHFQNIQSRRACEVAAALSRLPIHEQPHIVCFQELTENDANGRLKENMEKIGYEGIWQENLSGWKVPIVNESWRKLFTNPPGLAIYVNTNFKGVDGKSIQIIQKMEKIFTPDPRDIVDLSKVSGKETLPKATIGADIIGNKGALYALVEIPNGIAGVAGKCAYIGVICCHPSPYVTIEDYGIANILGIGVQSYKAVAETHKRQMIQINRFIKSTLKALGKKQLHGYFITGDMNINRYAIIPDSHNEKDPLLANTCCSSEYYKMLKLLNADQPPIVPDVNKKRWVDLNCYKDGYKYSNKDKKCVMETSMFTDKNDNIDKIPIDKIPVDKIPVKRIPPGFFGKYTWDGSINEITKGPFWPASFSWIDYILYYYGDLDTREKFIGNDPIPLYMDNRAIRLMSTTQYPEINAFATTDCIVERQIHSGKYYRKLKSIATDIDSSGTLKWASDWYKESELRAKNNHQLKKIFSLQEINKDIYKKKKNNKFEFDIDTMSGYEGTEIDLDKYKEKFTDKQKKTGKDKKTKNIFQCKFTKDMPEFSQEHFMYDEIPQKNKENPYSMFLDVSDHYAVISYIILPTKNNKNLYKKTLKNIAKIPFKNSNRDTSKDNIYDRYAKALLWNNMGYMEDWDVKDKNNLARNKDLPTKDYLNNIRGHNKKIKLNNIDKKIAKEINSKFSKEIERILKPTTTIKKVYHWWYGKNSQINILKYVNNYLLTLMEDYGEYNLNDILIKLDDKNKQKYNDIIEKSIKSINMNECELIIYPYTMESVAIYIPENSNYNDIIKRLELSNKKTIKLGYNKNPIHEFDGYILKNTNFIHIHEFISQCTTIDYVKQKNIFDINKPYCD
jgi:hypothetical protein